MIPIRYASSVENVFLVFQAESAHVPSFAHQERYFIFTGMERIYRKGDDLNPFFVVGYAGKQVFISQFLAVYIRFKQSQPGGIQSGTAKARVHLERTPKDRMPGCACWRSDPIRLPGFLHFPCFQPCFPLSRIPLIPKDGYTDPIAGAGFQRSFQALASHIQVSTFFLGQYSSLLVEQPDSDVLRPLAGCIGHLERNRQKGQLIANGFL